MFSLAVSACLIAASPAWAGPDPIQRDFPGWTTAQKVSGDLQRTGARDFAALLSTTNAPSGKPDALVVVYLDRGSAGYQLAAKAPGATCFGCGGAKTSMDEPWGTLSISPKGIFSIIYEGGSREVFADEVKWRWDPARRDMLLIGETSSSIDSLEQEPDDHIDINYSMLRAERTLGKKRSSCRVPSKFHALPLSSFDIAGAHDDDLAEISESCSKGR